MNFGGPLVLMFLVIIEVLAMIYIKKENVPLREVNYNMSSGHILMWILRSLEVMVFAFVLNNYSLHWVTTWPIALQWIFTFFAWDFCFYWLHRMHHFIPLFWSVHVVHHEGEHFGLSLGIRNSWYSSLSSIPFFLILAVLGVPLEIFIPISSFHYTVQFYNHNGLVGKSGFLEHFMVTPSKHRVHHGVNPMYIDKNFGGTFNIWDKLFGTYQEELDDVQIKYGTHDPVKSDNPFWGNNIPVLKYFKMKLPNIEQDPSKAFATSDLFIGIGGIILWSLVVYYISRENAGLGTQQLVFFMLIFFATISLGGISDKRVWGAITWVLLANVLSIAFVFYYSLFDVLPITLFVAFFLHGLYVIKFLIAKPQNNNLSQASV